MKLRAALLLLPCVLAFSQDKLISFHVVALDNRGQPIGDLTQDDFQIQEQGKPLRILNFRPPGTVGAEESPLAACESSNRAGAAPASITVILFDLLNPMDLKFSRAQLTKAASNLKASDYVYLYILTVKGPYPVRGLPEGQIQGAPGPIPAAQIDTAFDAALKMNVDSYGVDTANLTYLSLQSTAARLSGLPGRKSIVWISRGVPVSVGSQRPEYSRDYTVQLKRLRTILERGNVAVYPVGDARREVDRQSMGTLDEVANFSGGRSHLDMDVGTAIQQAMDDARASYTLSFNAPADDDKYHKVRISSNRHGSKILAPEGYFGNAPGSAEQEKSTVEAAIWSPFDSGEIGVRASAVRGPNGVQIKVRIDAADVELQRKEDTYSGKLSVTLLAYDPVGRQRILKQTQYPFKMTAAQHEAAVKNGITLSSAQMLDAEAKKVRVVVYDGNANAIGSLTLPICEAP